MPIRTGTRGRRLIRSQVKAVPGSQPGANGGLGAVVPVGARAGKQIQRLLFPIVQTPAPRPPGDPTGRNNPTTG